MEKKMKLYSNKAVFGWEGDNGIGEVLIKQIIDGEKTRDLS